MTDRERRMLRLVARRAADLGLACGKAGCPHPEPADHGAGGKCPHLPECLAELQDLQDFARGMVKELPPAPPPANVDRG